MKECEACGHCFSDAVESCPEDGSPTLATLPGDPKIDRYLLERRLGQGGMGIVYKARHEYLHTTHALKVILPGSLTLDPKLAARFRQEALAMAAVKHPNVVVITDFGVVGAMPFFVMEFLEGKSLEKLLADEGQLTPARALEILKPVGDGVAAAHKLGIIHRDLKPLNVFIRDNLQVKVLDFGLAKVLSSDVLGSLKMDQSSGIVGSPFYLAPEQILLEEPDKRTDVYALGIILYQMLAGRPPFVGRTQVEVMRLHLESDPPPFISFGVRVPPRVEALTLQSLAKDRAQRPQSVEAFLDELSAAQDFVQEQEGPTPQPEQDALPADARFAATLPYPAPELRPELPPSNATPLMSEDAVSSEPKPQGAPARPLFSFLSRLFSLRSSLYSFFSRHRLLALTFILYLVVAALAVSYNVIGRYLGTIQKEVPPPPIQQSVLSPKFDLDEHASPVEAIAFSPRGDILAVGCLGGEVKLWEVKTGALRSSFVGVPDGQLLYSIAFMSGGDRLAVGTEKDILIWDTRDGREISRLAGHRDKVFALTVSPDGKLLASGSKDGEIHVWETETGKSLHTLVTANSIKALAFSPDSRTLASAGYDGHLRLWDFGIEKVKYRFPGQYELPGHGRLFAVAFSPDGETLASGDENGFITLWDLTFLNSPQTLKHNGGAVNSLAFSPGGVALVSGSDDKTAILWDVSKGKALQTLTHHSAEVNTVAFSPDGRLLATGSRDRKVTLWGVSAAIPTK